MVATLAASVLAASSAASPDIAWFQSARLGMFIHWGPVALRGTEIGWSRGAQVPVEEYDSLYLRFNPTAFDADAWMDLAKRAGFRYVVPTAKHHDGFCLWPSSQTDYDIMATPFRRDILAEISAAARKRGIAPCSYYSILDWRSPDYPLGSPGGKTAKENANMDRHMQVVLAETTELVRRYGLKMLWFDGQWEAPYTRERSLAFQRELRARFPKLVVNNRIEASGRMQPGDPGGDFATPEQHVGEYNTKSPWETCMTLGDQWAYRPNDRYKSLDQVLTILAQTVTGDGNLLLNVGPDAEGRIPPEQTKLLLGMGQWLAQHGQAVYGTRGGPFRNGAWGGATRRGRTVFLLVLDRKADQLSFPELPARVRSCRSLVPGMTASVGTEGRGIRVRLSGTRPEVGPAIIRLDLDRDAWSLGDLPGPTQTAAAG